MWVIKVESKILVIAGSWYMESAIQDSIVLTSSKRKAQRFDSKLEAESVVRLRTSWDPYNISTYIVEQIL